MIYTVGLTHIYEAKLDVGSLQKAGRRRGEGARDYPGGWVWRTPAEAHAYLVQRGSEEIRSVYGVDADWERDTEPAPGQPFNLLLRDAMVTRIPKSEGGTG